MLSLAAYPLIFIVFFLKYLVLRYYCRNQSTNTIYSSDNFIIIDKQADLKINSNNSNERTVQTYLNKNYPNLVNKKLYHEFYFPHRLDYATSGILCIPKTKNVCKIVSEAFSSRTTKKYYIALVYGLLSEELIDVDISIGEDLRKVENQKMCTSKEPTFCKGSRSARTIIKSLEEGTYNNYPATKILCRPITGRRHQIRVHCSFLGHTIIGDYTYSNGKDVKPPRMFLHSIRLVLPNCIEDIDISTKDPFEHVQNWRKTRTIDDLSEGYKKLDQLSQKN